MRLGSLGTIAAIASLLLITAGCATIAARESSPRQEIRAVIDQGLEATRTGDTSQFLARIPADFVAERPDGSIATRDELQRMLATRAQSPPRTVSLTVDIEQLDLRGDEAKVMTFQRWERMVHRHGEDTPRHVVSTQRHEELWRRRNGRWEAYRIKELGGDLTINGVRQEGARPAAPTTSQGTFEGSRSAAAAEAIASA